MSGSDDDGWVFDSLVNFLHGAIWKLPVMGFIEEKSVVFDPDSYNNMTDDKEEEFKKIHDEYKALVDYMLTSFMEDLQVTPEQVEESCRLREQNNKAQPESHITKVALEQLWAAEDFNAFRRLMTRKNIDLQLQSLELLVAKYGVLSPALRPPNSDPDDHDPNGEEDFLQVVIRYTEPENTVFHSSLVTSTKCCPPPPPSPSPPPPPLLHSPCETPPAYEILHQQTLRHLRRNSSSSSSSSSSFSSSKTLKPPPQPPTTTTTTVQGSSRNDVRSSPRSPSHGSNSSRSLIPEPSQSSSMSASPVECTKLSQILQQDEQQLAAGHLPTTPIDDNLKTFPPPPEEEEEQEEGGEPEEDEEESSTGRPSISTTVVELTKLDDLDEETGAEIASQAPEQHRLLTAVRRALDVPTAEDSEVSSDAPRLELPSVGSEEEIERRREYLRAQRDKLVALKKREREKQLNNFDRRGKGSPSGSGRPKSAKAAQIALKTPENITASTTDKSLQARRALALRLRQELVE